VIYARLETFDIAGLPRIAGLNGQDIEAYRALEEAFSAPIIAPTIVETPIEQIQVRIPIAADDLAVWTCPVQKLLSSRPDIGRVSRALHKYHLASLTSFTLPQHQHNQVLDQSKH
jgi:hypothetical protein